MSLQEKFQITIPPVPETDHEWAVPNSYISKGEAGFQHRNNTTSDANVTMKTNYMPPGMDISNQQRKRIRAMPLSMAGATDVSKDTNAEAFAQGYTRRDMEGTDDQYSGEHQDHFYGEVEDELGNCGFVERNNYLDRV
jgi:hypothetical protein